MSYISEIRTPEEKSKKMLKEEMTVMKLEMAIKKEEFRSTQKNKPKFRELYAQNPDHQVEQNSLPKIKSNNNNIFNSFLDKIGF